MSDNREYFEHFRKLVLSGAITLDQARDQTKERLDAMNAKGEEIAKRHGKKHKPFTFSKLMR